MLSKTHRSHGSAPVAAAASSEAIGVEGLKALLSQASATLGRCRFIVVNAAAGGILEAVEDFGAGSLRYSQPSPKGQYMTIGNSTFECHLNVEKIATVVFATKQSPGDQSSADEDNVMYIMRFLNKDGGLALSVVLHRDTDGHGYDSDQSGNPSGWKELVNKYGETVTIQQA